MTHHTGPNKIDYDHGKLEPIPEPEDIQNLLKRTPVIANEEAVLEQNLKTLPNDRLACWREGYSAGWRSRADENKLGGSVGELPPSPPESSQQSHEVYMRGMRGGRREEKVRWLREIDKMTDEAHELGQPTVLILEALVRRIENG